MSTLTGYGAGTYGAGTYGGVMVAPEPTWVVVVGRPDGSWLDVTCDVRNLAVDRGRSNYVDAFKAGDLEVVLFNPTGIYSTWPIDSIWAQAGGFVTDVPIRAGSVVAGDLDWRFTGTTDAVVDSWPGTTDAVATVRATDGFKLLARHNGGPRVAVGAGELSGARIHRLADDAGWTGPRNIDTGVVALSATTLDGVTVDLMRQVGESEWGWLFVDGAGALTFRQRNAVDTDPRMTTVQWVFTDDDDIITPAGAGTLADNPPLLLEAFDSLAAWSTATGWTITAGRTGTAAQTVTSANTDYRIPAPSESDTVTVGFAWQFNGSLTGNQTIVNLGSDAGATVHLTLTTAANGSMALRRGANTGTVLGGATAAGVLTAGAWYYIEVRATLSDTAGAAEVRVNGATVLGPLTGLDTKNAGTKAVFDTLRVAQSVAGTTRFDDLYLRVGADQAFYGDITIPPGPPSPAPIVTVAACYGDAITGADDDRIINVAQVTPAGHATISSFTDGPSRAWYGPRTWTRTDLPINLDTDAAGLCQLIVTQAASDDQRIDAVVIDGANRPTAWPAAHGCRINDRIRFVRTLPGGWQVDAELLVQGRRDVVRPVGDGFHLAEWQVTFATAGAMVVVGLGLWDVGLWDEALWGV